MRKERGKPAVASMVDEKCCRDTAEGIEKQQLEWVNEEIKRGGGGGGRCGKRKSGNCRSSTRSVKYSDEKKIIGGTGGAARRKGGKGASDSKLASEKREHDGSRGARTRRHRANGGGSLSSRGSAATGMQCGLCAVLASLFRRAMCIAGSRRGSGESCYQELATEMQQHHQGHSLFSQQSSQHQLQQRSPSFVAGSPLKIILPGSRSTSGSFNGSTHRLDDQSLRRERTADDVPGDGSSRQHDDAVFVRISETEDASLPASGTSPLGSTSSHSPPIDTELPPPDPRQRLLSEPDRLLIENLNNGRCFREKRHTGRFLTMHKRRRKRLITRSLSQEHALLDDIFHGQVQCVLRKAGHWRFNAFTLETVTGGRSLPVLCVHLFQFYGLFQRFNLDVVRAWKLFALIEEGYHSTNPYHNSIHATDVTQAMHCFLQEEKIKRHLSSLEIMASLIAAVTHDLDHPGVNQPFLVATSNHLATLYENTSVLENHHWRSAIACLLESGVYDQLPAEIRPELERHISSLILATDITRQQEFLTRFKATLDRQSLNMEDPENRHFILQISLKCADISNPCRPWDISRKWSYKVCEEFFRQGDYERQLNLPVTPLCDRQSMSIPRIQVGFFEFVVTPLYEEWHRFLGDGLSVSLMLHLRENKKRWEALIAREAAEETKTEMSDLELIPSSTSTASEEEENGAGDNVSSRERPRDSESLEALSSEATGSMAPAVLDVRRPSLPGVEDLGQRRFDRRHSVPISVSKPFSILPMIEDATTADAVAAASNIVIRRESLPSERIAARSARFPMFHFDDGNLVDEALREMSSLSLLSSKSSVYESAGNASLSSERPVSAENLLPETSIASITSSATATRLSSLLQPDNLKTSCQTSRLHLTRQQTFPPLQPYVRIRYMSTTAEMAKCQTEALIEADDSLSSPEDASITDGDGKLASEQPLSSERLSAESGLVDNRVSSSRRNDETSGRPPRRHSVQAVSTQSDSVNLPFSSSQRNARPSSAQETRPNKHAPVSIDYSRTETRSPEIEENSSTRRIESSDMRRYSTPSATEPANVTSTTTSGSSSNYLAARRFTAIPLLTPEFLPTRKFFVGTPPGSPPRLLSVLSSSSDSGGSDPKPPGLADFNEAHLVGVKRDSSDNSRQRNCKIAKLTDDGDSKENLDPRASSDEANKTAGLNFARRTSHQSWARRRGSAPVGLLSKLDDSPPGTVAPRSDRHSTRRGSVPTDIIGQQVGGLRAALGPRGENVPLPRRASLPQETAITNLLGNVLLPTDERENVPSYVNNNNNNNNNNTNNNNKRNNNKKKSNNGGVGCAGSSGVGNTTKNNNNDSSSSSGSNNNEICRISESISRAGGDFESMGSPRRGSVPADISELRRDLFGRNSVNGKTRNRKKTLKRRSSGGPEMFSGRNPDDHENSKFSGWKRDMAKRDSSIPEPSVKRRGSLPVEMVSIFHPGSAAGARRSSLWRL